MWLITFWDCMKTVKLSKRKIDYKSFVQKKATEQDCGVLIREESIFVDSSTGQFLGLYCKPKDQDMFFEKLRKTCQSTKYQKSTRTGGLISTSRIFGFNPRNARRKNFCSVASLGYEQKKEHQAYLEGGKIASKLYQQYNPELHQSHAGLCDEKVLPEFKIKETPFTSGIVNDNNPLCYHFDAGNFHNVWSAMIVLKQGIKNGHLSMPEYGVKCEVADKSIFFFDGQSILHGVTPIIKTNAWAKRYSIVYYSLREMWKCLPMTEEIARIRNLRTKMEAKDYSSSIKKKANK